MESQDGGNTSKSDESRRYFTPHDTTDIFGVRVRPPPFWAEEPVVWFSQLEGNFMLSRITDDDTKFYYVTSTLEHRYAEVTDIIVSPPKTGKYERLKYELVKRLSASREKEVKELLIHEELEDRRPSQFLSHWQRLAGPSVSDDFIKTIWISRLPTALQPIFVAQKTYDLQALADLADSLHELVPCTSQVASTSAQSTIAAMAKQIDEVTKQVKALSARSHRPRSRSRRRSPTTRNRSKSNYRKFPLCWYHHKYRNNANHCVKPCDYGPENYKGSR